MVKNILIVLLMTMSTSLIGQDHNTYENFYKNRWEVPYNWGAGSDTEKSNNYFFQYPLGIGKTMQLSNI